GPRTEPGIVMGTVGYMSPEQAYGLPADHRSDLFSFGVIYFEMLTGQSAFRRASPLETLHAIAKEDIAEVSRTRPEVPAAVDRIIGHCIAKDPEDRFQSARDLVFALESLEMPPSHSPFRRPRNRPSATCQKKAKGCFWQR